MSEMLTCCDLETMRRAGKLAAYLLKKARKKLRPGISTRDIEKLFESYLSKYPDMEYAFKGFRGYPSSICVSINDEIIHGIPSSSKKINYGDIVSIDIGIKYKGLYVDTAYTYTIGRVSKAAQKLIKITKKALKAGIKKARIGATVGDIGAAIQNIAEKNGFSVIRKFVGHGIGRELHLAPEIPNFGKEGKGEELKEGMVIAIEPMVAAGNNEVVVLDDGWTAKTKDSALSAHFEHTVAITKRGPKILT